MADEKGYQEKVYELEKQVAVLYQKAIDGDKALVVALNNLSERLDEMNKFRAQIQEERASFLTKEVFDDKHEKLEGRVSLLSDWRNNMEGRFWALGAALAGFVVLLQLAIHWLLK
jgi:hypothetical protein